MDQNVIRTDLLPESMALADAAILYCMGMLAVKYDDIDIV